MMNCKEATQVSIRSTGGKLSMKQRFDLWMHVMMCKYCKLFHVQHRMLDKFLSKPSERVAQLTSEEKDTLKASLRNSL